MTLWEVNGSTMAAAVRVDYSMMAAGSTMAVRVRVLAVRVLAVRVRYSIMADQWRSV